LISAEQIRRIAREEKLAAGVVEKDYVLTWLLKGVYLVNSDLRNDFVLKGGTAIRKGVFSANLEIFRGFRLHRCRSSGI
jgi:predicted nucleotidyltransferase component of viral defense system